MRQVLNVLQSLTSTRALENARNEIDVWVREDQAIAALETRIARLEAMEVPAAA